MSFVVALLAASGAIVDAVAFGTRLRGRFRTFGVVALSVMKVLGPHDVMVTVAGIIDPVLIA